MTLFDLGWVGGNATDGRPHVKDWSGPDDAKTIPWWVTALAVMLVGRAVLFWITGF